MAELSTNVRYIKGIGETRAKALEKLGIDKAQLGRGGVAELDDRIWDHYGETAKKEQPKTRAKGLGALAQLTASVVHHGEEQELVFQCEKAKVAAPFSVYASISKPNGFPIENTELEQKIRDFVDAQPQLPYEGHAGELENVLSALEKDTLPAIGGEDGRRTIELITAVYKSGATKQTVTLPLQKDDPVYTVEGMMRAVPHFYEKTTSAASLDGTITLGSDYQQK